MPLAAAWVPLVALEVAGTDTEVAFGGAKRAKTGTPFFGYIIAETLENTDFSGFFHNQIAPAWLAFLNAVFSARAMNTFFDAELVTSAPRTLSIF